MITSLGNKKGETCGWAEQLLAQCEDHMGPDITEFSLPLYVLVLKCSLQGGMGQ